MYSSESAGDNHDGQNDGLQKDDDDLENPRKVAPLLTHVSEVLYEAVLFYGWFVGIITYCLCSLCLAC